MALFYFPIPHYMNAYFYELLLAQLLVWAIVAFLFCLTLIFRNFLFLLLLSFIGSTLVVHNFGFMMGYLPNFMVLLDQIDFVQDFEVVL